MAEVEFKYKDLEEAKKGYDELYGKFQKGQEEGNINKKDLETVRAELLKLKGGIEERGRREADLRNRLRQPGLTPQDKQRVNEQFLEQMKVDPTATFDSRIIQIIRGQGFVKKEDLEKDTQRSEEDEKAYNVFVASHKNFEEVRPTFTRLWNKLPPEERKTSSLELIFKAAEGEIATANPVNLEEEKEKLRKEIIQELKEKATLAGGRKIKTKKELEADEKEVSDIMKTHKESKVNIT